MANELGAFCKGGCRHWAPISLQVKMKTIINITIFLLIAFSALAFGTQNQPVFGIYLVIKDNDDLQKIELQQNPIITDADLVSYDWSKHEMILSNQGIKKMSAEEGTGLRSKSFVIVAKGARCYKGAFWSSIYSTSYPNPVINVGPHFDKRPKNIVRIERAYPSDKFAVGPDPRKNELIYKALSELKKIEQTK